MIVRRRNLLNLACVPFQMVRHHFCLSRMRYSAVEQEKNHPFFTLSGNQIIDNMLHLKPFLLHAAASCALIFGPVDAFVARKTTLGNLPITAKRLPSTCIAALGIPEYETEFKEFLEQKTVFMEFRDKANFRSAISKAAVFAGEDAVKLEQIVFQCASEIEEFSKDQQVYAPGDDPKGLYFVRSGEFECDFPDDMGGPKVFKEGEYFGGLGLITGEIAFGAKAIGEESNSLWIVDKDIYENVFPRLTLKKNLAGKILSGTGNTAPYVEQALEFLTIKQYLNQSYIFNGTLSEESLNMAAANIKLREFDNGEAVFRKGQIGESLYLVKSGEFQIGDDKKIVMTVEAGRLFGEFGALIDQERPFTVKAISDDCEAWEIPGPAVKSLLRDVKKGAFLQMLKEKYTDGSAWRVLKTIVWEEPRMFVALAKTASTPKTRKVSSHSTLSGIAVGAALLALLPHWQPGFTKHFVTFFKMAINEPFHLVQLNVSNALLMIVMLMGQLRFPKKTLQSRRVLFNTLSWGMMTNFFMGISNVLGTGGPYLIDAWTWPGRIILGGSGIACSLGISALYHDVLVGPENGRRANPFFETRLRGLIYGTIYNLSFFGQVVHMIPMLDSRAKFESFTAPLLAACGAPVGVLTYAKFMNNFYLSMGALYATFQYEERISVRTSNILLGITALFALTELYGFLILFMGKVNQGVHPFTALYSYLMGMMKKHHIYALWFGPMILSIIHGGITAFRKRPYYPKEA